MFIFVVDHIICDATAIKILVDELYLIYNAYKDNKDNPLKPLELQFKDYVKYHNEHYKGDKLSMHKSHFINLLKNTPAKLNLKEKYLDNVLLLNKGEDVLNESDIFKKHKKDDLNVSRNEITNGASYKFIISEEILNDIKRASSEYKVSLFNFIFTSYSVILSKKCNQKNTNNCLISKDNSIIIEELKLVQHFYISNKSFQITKEILLYLNLTLYKTNKNQKNNK